MEKEKLTPLVLTLGLIIYGCTASAGQNDKIDSDRTFTVHLYSPIIGDEDRGSIYGSGYSGPYLAPGGDTEVPPDPTPSYPSINQVDDQTNALMLSSIASAAVMYAADELLIDSTMKSRQGVRQTGPFAAARIGKYDLDVAGELDTTVITGLLGYTQTNVIVPDAHGDWLNQRDDSYAKFMRVDGKKTKESSIFLNYSNGIKSGRDSWVYNSSRNRLCENIKTSINYFNACVDNLLSNKDYLPIKDDAKIKWNETQDTLFQKKEYAQKFDLTKIRLSVYRPFIPSFLYFDKFWNLRQYQMTKIFPESKSKNLVICSSGVGSKEYSCLMVDHIPCLDFLEKTQCFPRWLPGEQTKGAEDTLDFGEPSEMPSGFSQEALPHFQAAYPGKPITEDDLFYYIYGILHSEDYRTRYANNLMKELPRIPRVATYEQFMAFVEAGQELARLHVHFEDVAPYAGVKIEYTKVGQPSYRVTQMKWGKIKGKTGNAAKDKTTLIYNDWITVKNIPLEAQEYVVNKKSALDWVVERACVSIDKASGIVNDFNDYAAEMGSERYPLDLFLKIITVSLETMKIVKTLPKLEIHPLDK
ncbi:type ISP restriction/modification enzyme [Sutterella wadsworthensis]|uniref:type ISP restriction/modification enzyme n=1 Tax=Sutterella wadsworthensis TaxID=40545 RepID=UPI0026DCF39C|nr:type ISP restriction/modification enzyme [Sutterella wadsworthensis]